MRKRYTIISWVIRIVIISTAITAFVFIVSPKVKELSSEYNDSLSRNKETISKYKKLLSKIKELSPDNKEFYAVFVYRVQATAHIYRVPGIGSEVKALNDFPKDAQFLTDDSIYFVREYPENPGKELPQEVKDEIVSRFKKKSRILGGNAFYVYASGIGTGGALRVR